MKSITNSQPPLVQPLTAFAIFFAIFALTVVSQYVSKFFGLIEIWSVNAIVTAVVVRLCQKHCFRLYIYIFIALFLGHIVSTQSQYFAFAKTLSDFSSITVAIYVLHYKLTIDNLRNHASMIKVLLAGLGASFTHVVVLAISTYGFGYTTGISLLSDFLGQWLGFSALLPLFLLLHLPASSTEKRRPDYKKIVVHLGKFDSSAPLITLLLSYLLFVLVGMPGAIIFILAALLYCTYFYPQLATALLVLISVVFVPFFADHGLIEQLKQVTVLHIRTMLSLQLGMQILVTLPLLISSTLAYRNDQIKALNKALDHDELTKAMSRQAFMRSATELIRKTPPPLYGNAILMLDIDYFKKLNDTHGHAAGDIVLMEFARSISNRIRPDDLFGRLGGEEFGLVFPNTTLENTIEIAERLRQDIEKIKLYYDSDEPLRITVSIGIAHDKQVHSDEIVEILSLADQAMYKAKNTGRNRICVFESSHD